MVAPFLYMLTRRSRADESLDHTPLVGPPTAPETFAAALAALPFGRLVLNSVIFSVAWSPAGVHQHDGRLRVRRLRFAGRDRLFLGYLSS